MLVFFFEGSLNFLLFLKLGNINNHALKLLYLIIYVDYLCSLMLEVLFILFDFVLLFQFFVDIFFLLNKELLEK